MADVIETETQGGQRGNKIGISKQLMKNEDKSEKTKKKFQQLVTFDDMVNKWWPRCALTCVSSFQIFYRHLNVISSKMQSYTTNR